MNLALVWGLPTLPELPVREVRPWETVEGHVAAEQEQRRGSSRGQAGPPLGRPDGAAPGTTKRERNGHVTLAQASWALACSVLRLRLQAAPHS